MKTLIKMLPDFIGLAGLGAFAYGIYDLWGNGAACIATGIILMAVAYKGASN